MGCRKTSVSIDEELLAAAKEALGTETVRETIDRALREVLQQGRTRARAEEVRALETMDGLDLADPEVTSSAWRG